jgi:hypothetical protein
MTVSLSAQSIAAHQRAQTKTSQSAEACELELELAKSYEQLGDWKDNEAHLVLAAKDITCRQRALIGIDAARTHEKDNLLRLGNVYELQHQWSKAEDVYRTAANDLGLEESTRKAATDHLDLALKERLKEDRLGKSKDSVLEWAKSIAEAVAILAALAILVFTIRSIWRNRRIIFVQRFDAPKEELANTLKILLKYARSTMNDPVFSGASDFPPFLVENMTFHDEIEPIEDLEIAGSKIPFGSLNKLFGQPRVRVTGGFDGVQPLGIAYSVVQSRDGDGNSFIRRDIRTVEPSEQRVDLLDFAYDVVVKASTAYVGI